jgi:hypothetical protein
MNVAETEGRCRNRTATTLKGAVGDLADLQFVRAFRPEAQARTRVVHEQCEARDPRGRSAAPQGDRLRGG